MKKMFRMISILFLLSVCAGCSKDQTYAKHGTAYMQDGKYEEAAKQYEKALALNSNRGDYYVGYAIALLHLSRYDEAVAVIDEIMVETDINIIQENNKRGELIQGIAYEMQNQYAKAEELLTSARSREILPELNDTIELYLGDAYVAQGKLEQARELYEALGKKKKNMSGINKRIGEVAYLSGGYGDAYVYYSEAIRENERDFESYLGAYRALMQSEKIEGKDNANTILNSGLAIEPKSIAETYQKAQLYVYMEDYDTAIEHYKLCLNAGITEANFELGTIYYKKKDYNTALYYYNQYKENSDALTTTVLNEMAVCYMKLEDYKTACMYLETAVTKGNETELKAMYQNMIITYEHLGQYQDAKKITQAYVNAYGADEPLLKEIAFIDTRLKTWTK